MQAVGQVGAVDEDASYKHSRRENDFSTFRAKMNQRQIRQFATQVNRPRQVGFCRSRHKV